MFREVKVKVWIHPKYVDPNSFTRKMIKGTGCFSNEFIKLGKFHQWGLELIEENDTVANYSVGIVEYSDGTIDVVLPQNIKFLK